MMGESALGRPLSSPGSSARCAGFGVLGWSGRVRPAPGLGSDEEPVTAACASSCLESDHYRALKITFQTEK